MRAGLAITCVGAMLGAACATSRPLSHSDTGHGEHAPRAGSAAWEAAVRAELLGLADADHSGLLGATEVATVACSVWQRRDRELRTDRATSLEARYGLEPGFMFRGATLGIASEARDAARERLTACALPGDADHDDVAALVRALVDLPAPTGAAWDRAAAALLEGAYDQDHSGALDRGDELTRVPCAVWTTFDEAALAARNTPFMALYGFADGYGYVGTELGVPESMRDVAADLMRACGLSAD